MSSSQELYNRLDETLRELVPVKNRKQVTNWIWIIVGILQSESCNMSKIGNCLPMETKAEIASDVDPALAGQLAGRRLAILRKGVGTCVIRLVECRCLPDPGWCHGVW